VRPARDSKITGLVSGQIVIGSVVTEGLLAAPPDYKEAIGFYWMPDEPQVRAATPIVPAYDHDEGISWVRGAHAEDSEDVQVLLAAKKLWESGQPCPIGPTGPTGPAGVIGQNTFAARVVLNH
jgi:hypothetical protein